MSVRDRAHSLPGWNFQDPPIAGIITGLMEVQTIDPLLLPYDCRHSKHTGTGPRHHTPSKPSMRGRACAYPPVEQAPEIVRLHLGKNASVWRAPLWLSLWKCGFRSVELKMPHWEYLLQGLHPGPHAWRRALGHGFLVCAAGCLVSNGHEAQIFFHMEELPWGILPTDPLKISHVQTPSL